MLGNRKLFGSAKAAVCFLLILSLFVGCGSETTQKPKKKVVKKIIVVEEEDSDTSSTESSSKEIIFDSSEEEITDSVSSERRPLYNASDDVTKVTPDKTEAEYSLKAYDWTGPDGYKIIYAKGNRTNMNSANRLRDYFKKAAGVTLTIADDSTAASAKEILVGDTNRFKTSLSANEYRVVLIDNKPTFEGGHSAMTEEAVKWFVSLGFVKGKINLITGKCGSFSAAVKGNYKYV